MHEVPQGFSRTQTLLSILISTIVGGLSGFYAATPTPPLWVSEVRAQLLGQTESQALANGFASQTVIKVNEESAIVNAVEQVSPAVVSIVATKDLPAIDEYQDGFFGLPVPKPREEKNELQQVGAGTGFIVSADGYIVTNRHVVTDQTAEYSVILNNEETYKATVLARDTVHDIAILKVDKDNLPYAELGNSDELKVGQTAIVIGNALAEFSNTVSLGVVSGLSRSVVAGGGGLRPEQLSNVIQTDASINPGNSGGPLVNISGRVIGINTAVAIGAENIGFAIPINEVRYIIESVRDHGRIIRPWIGVRYVPVNDVVAQSNQLTVSHGALIVGGDTEADRAVIPASPADKAGLKKDDIILEIDGKKIDHITTLPRLLSQKKPGDTVEMTVLQNGRERRIRVTLEEFPH